MSTYDFFSDEVIVLDANNRPVYNNTPSPMSSPASSEHSSSSSSSEASSIVVSPPPSAPTTTATSTSKEQAMVPYKEYKTNEMLFNEHYNLALRQAEELGEVGREKDEYMDKKARRRRRRRTGMAVSATGGAVFGGLILGPVGAIAGGVGAAAVTRKVCKTREKKKDDRVARQKLQTSYYSTASPESQEVV